MRHNDWFVWIPAIALAAAFVAGVLYSFLVGEPQPGVEPGEWFGK